ncbi:MAG: efflux RND transporter periplasmic adaptor subunit [Candidatus Moranbacteria bacterium]|jgi:membrane fusion protein (multidrug efflux system)|nr:efflux RND transporter periplasmic adaptor subunit [Candidatus Moranbacteria bacterium]
MKKGILIIGLIIVAGFIFNFSQKKVDSDDKSSVEVTVQSVSEISNTKEHTFGAVVKSTNEAVLAAQVNGTLKNIYFKEGEIIKQGQLIAQIEATEYQAKYLQAQISLKEVEEAEKLARRKWDDLKPEEKEQFKLESERLRAVLLENGAYLKNTRIVAPFDGVISSKFVAKGETVAVGRDLFRLIGDLSKKEIVFNVPVEIGENIKVGDKLEISHGDKIGEAQVLAINPMVDAQTRKIAVHGEIGDQSIFSVGTFVNVKIKTPVDIQGYNISPEAIVRQYDDTFVFVIDNNIAKMKKVIVLATDTKYATIEGLKKDDQIVVNGAHNLFDGDHIKIISN